MLSSRVHCAVSVAIENVCTYNTNAYSLKKAYEDMYTWATAYTQVHPPPPLGYSYPYRTKPMPVPILCPRITRFLDKTGTGRLVPLCIPAHTCMNGMHAGPG